MIVRHSETVGIRVADVWKEKTTEYAEYTEDHGIHGGHRKHGVHGRLVEDERRIGARRKVSHVRLETSTTILAFAFFTLHCALFFHTVVQKIVHDSEQWVARFRDVWTEFKSPKYPERVLDANASADCKRVCQSL